MPRPEARGSRPWLRADQEAERARWLLLATLAQEYPARFTALLAAKDDYISALEAYGGNDFVAAHLVQVQATAYLPSQVNSDGIINLGYTQIRPGALSLAIGSWAENLGLLACSGWSLQPPEYKHRTLHFQVATWVAKHAVTLLENEAVTAANVREFCAGRARDGALLGEFRFHERDRAPYPERPDVFFVPRMESKADFLSRAHVELDQYAEAILAWHAQHDYSPATEYRVGEKHFRWLAWHCAESKSNAEIAARESERFGNFPDAGDIGKEVRLLARLVGVVKESEPTGLSSVQ